MHISVLYVGSGFLTQPVSMKPNDLELVYPIISDDFFPRY